MSGNIISKLERFLTIVATFNMIEDNAFATDEGVKKETIKVVEQLILACSDNMQTSNAMDELKHALIEKNTEKAEETIKLCKKCFEQEFAQTIFQRLDIKIKMPLETVIDTIKYMENTSEFIEFLRPATFLILGHCMRSTCPELSYIYMNKAFELDNYLDKSIRNNGYVFDPLEPQHVFENCVICGSENVEPYYASFSYNMADFAAPHNPVKLWIKCKNCTNFYTYSFPEKLLNISKTAKKIVPNIENSENTSENTLYLAIWGELLNRLSLYTKGKDVLEVGVGTGEFIAAALEMGYDVEAIDIFEETCQNTADMLNIDVWCCDFLHFNSKKKYSIISMGDIIEHVEKPILALEKAYNLIKDDGVIWLSTPNFKSGFSRIRKFEDSMWCEPHHISYFSLDGLKPFIEKAGLQILEYKISNRYNGSMELILSKSK